MSSKKETLIIDYYSDVLCVWAWIAQRRIDELNAQFGDKILINYHYIDVFGDTATKMQEQWAQKGLYQGFSDHVVQSASSFKDAPVNPKIWSVIRPTTSANAHLVLKAASQTHTPQDTITLALNIRKAFFQDAQDISDLEVLRLIMSGQGLNYEAINNAINKGTALAALMNDYQIAKKNNLKGSPTYVMDNGRQTSYGNVGFRVLQANVQELLKHPEDEASWC